MTFTVMFWDAQEKMCNHNWLHHDNVPTHMSLKTIEFVTNNDMLITPHPPYSLDLPLRFHFVSQIEN
jgi:hypothetical protein